MSGEDSKSLARGSPDYLICSNPDDNVVFIGVNQVKLRESLVSHFPRDDLGSITRGRTGWTIHKRKVGKQ